MKNLLLAAILALGASVPAWADPADSAAGNPGDEAPPAAADETVDQAGLPPGQPPTGVSRLERKREPACRAEAEKKGLTSDELEREVRACQRRPGS